MPRIYQWAIGADRGAWRSRRQPVSVLLRNRLVVSGEVLLLARSQTHFDLSLGIGEANYDSGWYKTRMQSTFKKTSLLGSTHSITISGR
jgi:hypothetical protein